MSRIVWTHTVEVTTEVSQVPTAPTVSRERLRKALAMGAVLAVSLLLSMRR